MTDNRRMDIKCPICDVVTKDLPRNMGDVHFKCSSCGKYIHYKHRTGEIVTSINKPNRASSSGNIIY